MAVPLVLALLMAGGVWWSLGIGPQADDVGVEAHPHVVLIIIDTLRADALGSHGGRPLAAPALDAMAAEGVRFDQAIAQSSWTRPSIGSMITSLPPRALGIYDEEGDALDDGFVTLAEVLQDHGYRTVGVTANPNINTAFNFHQGFDRYIDTHVVFRWMEPEPGQVWPDERPLPLAEEVFQAVEDELDGASAEDEQRPHYLQINLMEVHEWGQAPRIVRSEYAELFSDAPPVAQRYLRVLRQVSDDIGRFVDDLTARPGWDDTLFVFVSDHGEGLHSHTNVPLSVHHGRLLYDSQLHVPWIMYSPSSHRLPRGRVVRRPVRLLEVMPTVLGLLGMAGPPTMQGRSLAPLVTEGRDVPLPEVFFAETAFQGHEKVGVRTAQWLYVENRDGHEGLPPQELQRARRPQDGSRTDQAAAEPDVASHMGAVLRKWERDNPPSPRSPAGRGLSPIEREQLEALGYMQ